MGLEVDVQPMGAALPGNPFGLLHEARRDALPAKVRMNAGIEDEGVNATVPGDVDEADDRVVLVGTDMSKGARQDVGKAR